MVTAKLPTTIKPMLGRLARNAFDSPDYLFELKWDGMRAMAFIEGGEVKILSRNGRNITSNFPELFELPAQVKSNSTIIDGEIVCLDEQNRPSFSRLQHRVQSKRIGIKKTHPITFIAFDLLYQNGGSVMKRPLVERKNLLADLLEPTDVPQACEFVENDGTAFFQANSRRRPDCFCDQDLT